ncbi:protein DipZ [Microbacterium nanhaiense]|uniref:Protein DipZ n=1 Tax=Microbacterium nanhaiense TaxID=1301026 RepID=A0ABQ2N1W2_9MICO|nr:cytochrome c biogenesis protein DipZ [Microbacterium nanhaiense]GGO63805.1 protein DipZ [Microbacterium nanhaiense]
MTLVIIGFLGGLITGISPCILPILPVVFLTGGAQSAQTGTNGEPTAAGRSRPYLVIAGLIVSFTAVTLAGSLVLGALGLPQSFLRWAGIVVLAVLGIALIVPRLEQLLERPFQWIPRREVSNERGGFGVGLALGTVFVPCAGPVLAAIIVAGSTGRIDAGTVVLTVSFSLGVAIPLLAFALAGRGVVRRIRAFRNRERGLRIAAGVAMLALAGGLVVNAPAFLQRLVPDYTAALQQPLAEDEAVQEALSLGGLVTDENRRLDECLGAGDELASCGPAPEIRGIDGWLNTPGGEAVSLEDLRGEVVLIDFWAYSCINCQRSIPHVTAWDDAYRDAGLRVIGVHSPEYAFEKDRGNVEAGARDFGIEYPVALDNSLATWTAYRNRYWPAHYLIDASGTVRHIAFGEGNYEVTEKLIRQLLADADPNVALPAATDIADETPELGSTTPETFLGAAKEQTFGGSEEYRQGEREFALPEEQAADTFALDGTWEIGTQAATPSGEDGTIRLRYRADEVRIVVAGEGTLNAEVDGERTDIEVSGTPRSYSVRAPSGSAEGTIEVVVPAGVEVYSFTFG